MNKYLGEWIWINVLYECDYECIKNAKNEYLFKTFSSNVKYAHKKCVYRWFEDAPRCDTA
jgi:hypothetical protein